MGKLAEKGGCKPASELILPITATYLPRVRFPLGGEEPLAFPPSPFTSVLPLVF